MLSHVFRLCGFPRAVVSVWKPQLISQEGFLLSTWHHFQSLFQVLPRAKLSDSDFDRGLGTKVKLSFNLRNA